MIRLCRKRILVPSLFLLVTGSVFLSLLIPVDPGQLYGRVGFSYRFYDRYGNLLHAGLSSNGFLFEPVSMGDIPAHTVAALVLLEDRRFFSHAGIDFQAVGRALWQQLSASRTRSGASTLTMQLARNVFARPRTVFSKLLETWYALRLEKTFTKGQILEHYFNTIPFGSRIIGIRTASRYYFDRPVEKLSPAQGAYLAALARFPAYAGKKEHKKTVHDRQLQALKLLREDGILDAAAYRSACAEQIVIRTGIQPRIAPHFTDMLLQQLRQRYAAQLPRIQAIHTTLDSAAQLDCETKAAAMVRQLADKRISNAAVVLLDNNSGELRALVGSIDYSGHEAGQVNGATAVRSPGSALKPFVYTSAFTRNLATAADPIADVRTDFHTRGGDYNPENYSRSYHGPISVRQALACSYNIPAVKMLQRTGIITVLQDLRGLHFDTLDKTADWYGLTMALGGGSVTLLQLGAAYLALARDGEYRPVRMIRRIETRDGVDLELSPEPAVRVYSPAAAFLTGDILADNDARTPEFSAYSPLRMPFFCAAKTGTSRGFRDNWTLGYTRNWTLGVWVGNFDGTPMEGISGITGAAPLFRQILLAREDEYDWRPQAPPDLVRRTVCSVSGALPGTACPGTREEWFNKNNQPAVTCPWHFSIPFLDNDTVAWHAVRRQDQRQQGITLKRVEVLPEEYAGWLKEQGRATPGEDILRYIRFLRTGVRPAPVRPRVFFPDDGDIFAIDPILDPRQQRLTMRARLGGIPQKACWILNETNRIEVGYPWTLEWKLQRGTWQLAVETVWDSTNRLRSRPVFFQVY